MSEKTYRRVVIIAPTRSTCVNIHTVLENKDLPPTLLLKLMGGEIRDAIDHLNEGGFGVVAGTGTGKTVAIRDICERVLGTDLTIDVVTREHEATARTWTCNVLVVTPGMALNWLKAGKLGRNDLIVLDEVHQTSDHLELSMAFAKRSGCTFIWMSATIDPTVYTEYLGARTVIRCDAFDPSRKAEVELVSGEVGVLLRDMMPGIIREKRRVAIFVPTRAKASEMAAELAGNNGVYVDFYHGGESADKLRPFLNGTIEAPFMIFMTIAGASSLNIVGLDTVVIVDEMYTEVVRPGGVRSLERVKLGSNELLQMGGRVNGRAVGGQIKILASRTIDFHGLAPTAPQFVLGGDLEQLALVCARAGVDARELDLIGDFDHEAYIRVLERFVSRELIVVNEGGEPHLTELGKRVERLPVQPAWGEILVRGEDFGDADLMKVVAVCACIDQLFNLTRGNWNRKEFGIAGSDHLTAYNIVTSALLEHGFVKPGNSGGLEYRLRGDYPKRGRSNGGAFTKWCETNGFSHKEIKNVLLAVRSVFRSLGINLPDVTEFPEVAVGSTLHTMFIELLAAVQSLAYVRNQQNSLVGTVFASRDGMSGAYSVLGAIRHWKDRHDVPRASIEGTSIPETVVGYHAKNGITRVVQMGPGGETVLVESSKLFAGERVGVSSQRYVSVAEVPVHLHSRLREVFADWLATHPVVTDPRLGAVLDANRLIVERARSLNCRTSLPAFPEYEAYNLSDRYREVLKGARCLSEVTDPEVLRLPELDPEQVAVMVREYPDTIRLLGRDMDVTYLSGLRATVALPHDCVADGSWRQLPETNVTLPCGRVVALTIELWPGMVQRIESWENPRDRVRVHLNRRQWEIWAPAQSSPAAPEDLAAWDVPEVASMPYGVDALTGRPLTAYGAYCTAWSFDGPAVRYNWYETLAQANMARRQVVVRMAHLREQEAARRCEEEITHLKRQLRQILTEFGDEMDRTLVARLERLSDGYEYFADRTGYEEALRDALDDADRAINASEDPDEVTVDSLAALVAQYNKH